MPSEVVSTNKTRDEAKAKNKIKGMHSWANEDDDIDKELMDQMKKDKEVNFHEFGIAPELYLDKQERKQILSKIQRKAGRDRSQNQKRRSLRDNDSN